MTAFSSDQSLILVILPLTVALFLWGRWRHDMVAVASLLACLLAADKVRQVDDSRPGV